MRFNADEADAWPLERVRQELEARQLKMDERNHQLRESYASQEAALRDLLESGAFVPEEDDIDDLDEPLRSDVRRLVDKEQPAGLIQSIAILGLEIRTLQGIIARKGR
jgi:hypothetical protein